MKKIIVICQKNDIIFSQHIYKLGIILKEKYKNNKLLLVLISDGLITKKLFFQIFLLEFSDIFQIITDLLNRKRFFYRKLFDEIMVIKNKEELIKISSSADIIYILTCKYIFPKNLCERIHILNLHCGLLPSYRGILPVFWSFYEGNYCGVTLHRINEEIDRGEIIANYQLSHFYTYYQTLQILYSRGIELIKQEIKDDHSYVQISTFSYYKYPNIVQLITYKILRLKYKIKLIIWKN